LAQKAPYHIRTYLPPVIGVGCVYGWEEPHCCHGGHLPFLGCFCDNRVWSFLLLHVRRILRRNADSNFTYLVARSLLPGSFAPLTRAQDNTNPILVMLARTDAKVQSSSKMALVSCDKATVSQAYYKRYYNPRPSTIWDVASMLNLYIFGGLLCLFFGKNFIWLRGASFRRLKCMCVVIIPPSDSSNVTHKV